MKHSAMFRALAIDSITLASLIRLSAQGLLPNRNPVPRLYQHNSHAFIGCGFAKRRPQSGYALVIERIAFIRSVESYARNALIDRINYLLIIGHTESRGILSLSKPLLGSGKSIAFGLKCMCKNASIISRVG